MNELLVGIAQTTIIRTIWSVQEARAQLKSIVEQANAADREQIADWHDRLADAEEILSDVVTEMRERRDD